MTIEQIFDFKDLKKDFDIAGVMAIYGSKADDQIDVHVRLMEKEFPNLLHLLVITVTKDNIKISLIK